MFSHSGAVRVQYPIDVVNNDLRQINICDPLLGPRPSCDDEELILIIHSVDGSIFENNNYTFGFIITEDDKIPKLLDIVCCVSVSENYPVKIGWYRYKNKASGENDE